MLSEKQMNRVMMTRPVVSAAILMLEDHLSDILHSDQVRNVKKQEIMRDVRDIQMLLQTLTH